ncbi:MAG: hypothetical protein ABIJ59_16420 [Pseudomonadota bacterium]
MPKPEKVQLNLYVSKEVRTQLHIIAAKKMFNDPQKSYSAAGVGAEFLTEYLNSLKQEDKS